MTDPFLSRGFVFVFVWFCLAQEIRTAQTFAAFPVHYRIHLYVAAAFATADKVTSDDIASKASMLNMLKSRLDDQRHIIGAFELLCQARFGSVFCCFLAELRGYG